MKKFFENLEYVTSRSANAMFCAVLLCVILGISLLLRAAHAFRHYPVEATWALLGVLVVAPVCRLLYAGFFKE